MKKYILLLISAVFLTAMEVYPQYAGPADQSACLGETVEFVVEHSFDYVTFSWEEAGADKNFTAIQPSGAYSGISSDALSVSTGVLNPSVGGFFRYYRCSMFSTIYGGPVYSDTAILNIFLPPHAGFNYVNPCEGQMVQFIPDDPAGQPPYKYHWDFDDAGSISVYSNPFYLYTSASTYDVTLTVTDANGCSQSVTRPVEIVSIPDFQISGKEVVCSNELDVSYSVDLGGEAIHYKWDVSGYGNIDDDTKQNIKIDWFPVEKPTQTRIMLTVTIDPSGCTTQQSMEVLITSYVAPDTGTVFRKPNKSTVLIYKGTEVNSYHWGWTDSQGDHYKTAEEGGERFYCDFLEGFESENEYWVETSFDSRINCVTRSYLKPPYPLKDMPGAEENKFSLFPVPAQNQLTITFDKIGRPSGIVIYNMMMQKVFSDFSLDGSKGTHTINLEALTSGVYIIQVADDTNISNFRVFTIEK